MSLAVLVHQCPEAVVMLLMLLLMMMLLMLLLLLWTMCSQRRSTL